MLKVTDLKIHYPVRHPFELGFAPSHYVKAVDGVSFELKKGEILGIVGESGCGKSTLAKALLQIQATTGGSIELNGSPLKLLSKRDLCHHIQMVFQDPYSSINPRKKAWQIIAEPLMIHTPISSRESRLKAIEVMEKVGLSEAQADRYPHMFSGGQRQRIGLARALIMHPKILVLDEPVSALDVSIQAQVINLLLDIQKNFELSYVLISHDLSVVRHLCDNVMVMYLGKTVEYAPKEKLFTDPLHPYTKALLAATPSLHRSASWASLALKGELPSPLNPPSGCAFHKRCPLAEKRCQDEVPPLGLTSHGENHLVSCHLVK